MERKLSSVPRQFRCKSVILDLLRAHEQSGLSIQAFCVERNIATGNFHRWKKQYNQEAKKNQPAIAGFSSLQLKEAFAETLFAEVKGIKFYQPVTAAYLKELVS
jgi:hypothetical protein